MARTGGTSRCGEGQDSVAATGCGPATTDRRDGLPRAVPCPETCDVSDAEGRTLRRIAADTLRFQRSALLPFQGLRVAVGTVVAMALGTVLVSPGIGAAAAGGSLAPGLASLDTEGRAHLGRAAATGAVMALATFLGSLTGSVGWLHIVLTGTWAAGWGLLAAVEPGILTLSVNAIVALVVFGRFPAAPLGAAELAAAVAAGGGVQLLLGLVLRSPLPQRREARELGRAFQSLAAYAASIPQGGSSLAAGAAIEEAAAAVAGSPVTGDRREAWEALGDEAERLRLELLGVAHLREHSTSAQGMGAEPGPTLDLLLAVAHEHLAAIGEALASGRPPGGRSGRGRSLAQLARELDGTLAAAAGAPGAEALAGQLRAAEGLLAGARAHARPLEEVGDALRLRWLGRRDPGATVRRLRANLSWHSSALRHAVRLAVAVSLATLIGHLTGLPRSYWIGMTAVLVLRPDYASTVSRGAARAAGTLVGVGVASLVALALNPGAVGLDISVGIFTAVAASVLFASYTAFTVALTGAVVFLLATLDTSPVADAGARLLATAIGSALALAVYAAWPSWSAGEARRRLVELTDAERGYVVAVLRACAAERAERGRPLSALERRLRLARTNAEVAVAQNLGEPAGRRLDRRWTAGVLAALRRLSLSAHTLRARRAAAPAWPELPGIAGFAAAVDAALVAAGGGMDGGAAPADLGLRSARSAALGAGGAPEDVPPLVAVETDEIVDAVNTLLHLVATGGEARRAAGTRPAAAAP